MCQGKSAKEVLLRIFKYKYACILLVILYKGFDKIKNCFKPNLYVFEGKCLELIKLIHTFSRFAKLGDEIVRIDKAGADLSTLMLWTDILYQYYHWTTYYKGFKKSNKLPFDVHQ